jgi:transcriptional regulator with XRE-family HTH domain
MAELARRSGLDPSLLSRLAAKDRATRRAPNLEHVLALARALGVTAPELVAGTDAAGVFSDWLPRSTFEAEVAARLEAQRTHDEARGKLAAAEGELSVVREQLQQAERRASDEARRARAAEARVGELLALNRLQEEDLRIVRHRLDHAEKAWAGLQARFAHVQQQLASAKSAASAAAGLALVGTIVGGVLGHALGSGDADDE